MIVKNDLVKKIKDYFNLNIYETKVWLALLSKGIASAGEIAEMSGVPRSRTYDVLESLEKQGFVIEKVGKPVKYIVVKPTVILEKLKQNALRHAEEKVETLENLKGTKEYAELESLHQTGLIPIKVEEISGAIKGSSNIYGHMREAIESAQKEIIICMSASEFLENSRKLNSSLKKLNDKTIKARIAFNGTDEDIKRISGKYGLKAMKTDIKSKFIIIDRKQVLFNLNTNKDDDEMAVWLNSEFFSNSLAQLFEFSWKN